MKTQFGGPPSGVVAITAQGERRVAIGECSHPFGGFSAIHWRPLRHSGIMT
jgi:hypothetical protein